MDDYAKVGVGAPLELDIANSYVIVVGAGRAKMYYQVFGGQGQSWYSNPQLSAEEYKNWLVA
jgi:hypothetical protein